MNVIDDLIPTGVMNHLIEKYYTKTWKFAKVGKEPQILTLDDLAFGFNIWLGFCLLSLVGHVAEHLVRFITKPKKLKFAKVHPINDEDDVEVDGNNNRNAKGICDSVNSTEETSTPIEPESIVKIALFHK